MKKTRLLLVLSLALFSVYGVQAQEKVKVLDKSAKKVPNWVNSSQTDYIITSAMDADLETAKNRALDNVRRYIIESVAENVKSSTEGNVSQTVMNNEIVHFLDDYKSTYESRTADVPFMKGISASRIEDFYWEKRQDKSSKKTYYVYSIKYPFPSVELKRMVYEFEKRDQEMYAKYQSLAGELNNITSLEQIDRAISELGPIVDYFFDDTRKNQAQALRTSYTKLYSNITFRTVWQTLGEYRFQLMLDGKPISTSQRMTLKADCATQLKAEPAGDMIVVSYNYDACRYDDENSITVSLRIGGKSVSHKFFYTIKKYDVEIWPEKTVYLTANDKSESELFDINIRISMKSGHNNPYRVNTLTLEIPGLAEPIFLDNLNTTFNAKESTLNVTWIGAVQMLRAQNNRLNMLRGNMEVEIPDEDLHKRIDFALPFRANW